MATNRTVVVVVLLAFACHKRAGSELFGAKVTPPGVLAKIRPGMTVAELEQLVPGMHEDPGRGYVLGKPASNATLYAVAIHGEVTHTYVSLDGSDGRALLEAAWGPPDAEPDREDHDALAWRSTTTGWRASLFCAHGTEKTPIPWFCNVTFHPHKPLEAMFGSAVAPPDELAKVDLGMPVDAMRTATHLPLDNTNSLRNLDYDGAIQFIDIVDGKLFRLAYQLPPAARPMIEKAWGSGTPAGSGRTVWFDPHTHWCAGLDTGSDNTDELSLDFVKYMPFDAVIDMLDKLSGAATYDEAHKIYPELAWGSAESPDEHTLEMPLTEMATPSMSVLGHTIVGVLGSGPPDLVMTLLDPAKQDAILATLDKRWGQPVLEKDHTDAGDDERYVWPGHGVLLRDPDSLGLTIRRAEQVDKPAPKR